MQNYFLKIRKSNPGTSKKNNVEGLSEVYHRNARLIYPSKTNQCNSAHKQIKGKDIFILIDAEKASDHTQHQCVIKIPTN